MSISHRAMASKDYRRAALTDRPPEKVPEAPVEPPPVEGIYIALVFAFIAMVVVLFVPISVLVVVLLGAILAVGVMILGAIKSNQ